MITEQFDVLLVETTTRGRVLVRESAGATRGLLVGFHGYAETAAIQLERLASIPGAETWTLVSIQGLNRFYRSRTEDVVAGWMTREDRNEAIADNIRYVDAVVERVQQRPAATTSSAIVCVGFSQGVAMAFRASVLGRAGATAVVAAGGDVPPELLEQESTRFPPTLLTRGRDDNWYTQAKLDADAAALTTRGSSVITRVLPGGHEWTPALSLETGNFLRHLRPGHR